MLVTLFAMRTELRSAGDCDCDSRSGESDAVELSLTLVSLRELDRYDAGRCCRCGVDDNDS